MEALCPGAGGTKEGSRRCLLWWPLLFTPSNSSPGAFLAASCPVCGLRVTAGRSSLSPYCCSHVFGQGRWNPVWLLHMPLWLTWPRWGVETCSGDSRADVIVLSAEEQREGAPEQGCPLRLPSKLRAPVRSCTRALACPALSAAGGRRGVPVGSSQHPAERQVRGAWWPGEGVARLLELDGRLLECSWTRCAERSETLFPRRQQCDQLRRCAFLGRALGAQPAEACLPSPPPFHLSPSLLTLGESPQARGGHSSLSPTAGEVAWHSCAQGNEFAGGSSFLTKPWGPEGWGWGWDLERFRVKLANRHFPTQESGVRGIYWQNLILPVASPPNSTKC